MVETETPWEASPRWGIAFARSKNVVVQNCYVTKTDYEGISFWSDVQSGVMYGNKVYSCGFGLVTEKAGTMGTIISNNDPVNAGVGK